MTGRAESPPLTRADALAGVLLDVRPIDRRQLRGWIAAVLDIDVPAAGHCPGHASPMDYLAHTFFEREGDVLVWANRGGGKTFYGAVATLLDMLFKPGIAIRILGGSLDQSQRMYAHLRRMLDRPALRPVVDGRITERRVRLINHSEVELLAQAQTSVRGQRVQKLRCDEVDLFEPDVWQAAQFVTRSQRCGDVFVPGRIEAFSTMHRPFGLMQQLTREAEQAANWHMLRWCAMDVIERCEPGRSCDGCDLHDVCGGWAKSARGFVSVDDIIAQRRRSGRDAFDSEMLCRRPSRSDAVFAAFDPAVHVASFEPDTALPWVGGMDFGLRHPTVVLWAQLRPIQSGWRVEVIDEYLAKDQTIDRTIDAMADRPWPRPGWLGADPAGHQRNDQTGTSNIAVLRRAGWRIRTRRSLIAEGVAAIRRRLDPAVPPPRLVIHPRCVKLIESLAGYHFDARRPDCPDPVKDGPDHAVDALRYLVVNLESTARVQACDY